MIVLRRRQSSPRPAMVGSSDGSSPGAWIVRVHVVVTRVGRRQHGDGRRRWCSGLIAAVVDATQAVAPLAERGRVTQAVRDHGDRDDGFIRAVAWRDGDLRDPPMWPKSPSGLARPLPAGDAPNEAP